MTTETNNHSKSVYTNIPVTGTGDIVQLICFKSEHSKDSRDYELCKCVSHDIYFLLISDDCYPAFVSKAEANSIIEDPKLGASKAANIWFSRYR